VRCFFVWNVEKVNERVGLNLFDCNGANFTLDHVEFGRKQTDGHKFEYQTIKKRPKR